MLTADQLIDLNAGAIAAAPKGRTQFALRFAPPDSAADIAQFEALSGVPVPAPLRALYQGCGAFSHPGFGTPNTNPAVQTIHMRSVRDCILQRRQEIGAGRLSCGKGLYGHTLDVWGGRPDLEEWLTEETQQRLDANYIVFAMRYVNDGEHLYLIAREFASLQAGLTSWYGD